MTDHIRVPTGRDGGTEELRVRIVDGQLDLRVFKRSPASFEDADWHATAAGVTVAPQFTETLIQQLARVAGLVVSS